MKYLKNKTFQRDLKENKLGDEDIKEILDNIFKGRAVSLGFKMYKIRGAKEGQGKSGGFRSLFFWKNDELIVFCLLFTKNDQDNISFDEYKALRLLSREYEALTEVEIRERVENKSLIEVEYERHSS